VVIGFLLALVAGGVVVSLFLRYSRHSTRLHRLLGHRAVSCS
jgi:hypothetical protein